MTVVGWSFADRLVGKLLSQSDSYLQVILCIHINAGLKEGEKTGMKVTYDQKSSQKTELPSLETRSACTNSC
jgi:hypothetical protein